MRQYAFSRPDQPFLLAADIDGTLLGDEIGESLLRELALSDREGFLLAYISGRSRASIFKLVDEGRLPRPDFVCGCVGTDLTDLRDPANAIGKKFISSVAPGWDLAMVYSQGEGPGVQRQDFPDGQPPFHAGFFWDSEPASLEAFRSRLDGLGAFNIYPAMNAYIDVIPVPLGKGGAVSHLQKELGIDKALVVVAGDSGNDLQMFETGFKGIIPVNALDELKAAAVMDRHYLSPFPAALGVLDGLRHFGFLKAVDPG